MSLDTHSSLATYLPTTVRHSNPHEVMFPTTTKFIGAVEDEWQLFRWVYFSLSLTNLSTNIPDFQ